MLNLNGITVRLGGRTILDRATAALPPYGRVGLIGRNGAGKSTLMKVMIGSLEADDGSLEMPKGTRIGYIAQDAPAGDATPFETVLAADTERAALMHGERGVSRHRCRPRPPRRGARAADRDRCLYRSRAGLAHPRRARLRRGNAGASRSTVSRAAGKCAWRWRRCCSRSPTCCCSTSLRTTSISKRPCGSKISSKAIPR